ncbi:hypothetical protein FALBO_8752 [Fusarium albosuccineum]|uniref:C3H1-type domain-containing protein n=1 Tax=Fusarium albosuccineum TaxID=1237068 RepID=A0A8H4L939_9HYPO|nr:hypothetical protein FALBO_8752 [Fusarium albosuccineum]
MNPYYQEYTPASRSTVSSSSSPNAILTPTDNNSSPRHSIKLGDNLPSSARRQHPEISVRKTSIFSSEPREVSDRHGAMNHPAPSGVQNSPYVVSNGYPHLGYSGGWQQSPQIYQVSAPRSMASGNWRGSQPAGDSVNSMTAGIANYSLTGPTTSPTSSSSDGPVSISDCLNGYAYCVQRPDGRYTRLVPADMLPPLNEIPPKQASAQGMVLLPDLHMQPPQGVAKMNQSVSIKSRIDRIVATSPTQQKKTKIYCDKWIHDGTCAFTQQGCKYKHEMPADKQTQQSLGLFHGFPKWWKDLQEDLQKRQNREAVVRRSQSILQQDWRGESNEDTSSPATTQAPIGAERLQKVGKGHHQSPSSNDKQAWGPLEPPQRTGSESDWVITPTTLKGWTKGREHSSPHSSTGSVERALIQ